MPILSYQGRSQLSMAPVRYLRSTGYGPGFIMLKSIIRDLKKDGSVWTNLNCENVEKQNAVYLVKMKIEENQNLIMDFHQYGVKKNV